MTTHCKFCGGKLYYEPIEGIPFELKPSVCSHCDKLHKRSDAAAIEADRHRAFKELCPPLYADTDVNHPGMPEAHKQAAVLNWIYGPRGLVLHGNTRKGKTRLAWLLIKRLVIEGRSVEAITENQFASGCGEMCGAGAEQLRWWKDGLIKSSVLFLDDLGKCKLTERVEAELFDVFDYRCSNRLPTLFTTNYRGDQLAARFTPDRGAPFVARLREFCEAIAI